VDKATTEPGQPGLSYYKAKTESGQQPKKPKTASGAAASSGATASPLVNISGDQISRLLLALEELATPPKPAAELPVQKSSGSEDDEEPKKKKKYWNNYKIPKISKKKRHLIDLKRELNQVLSQIIATID
jgi:hypothetical protein